MLTFWVIAHLARLTRLARLYIRNDRTPSWYSQQPHLHDMAWYICISPCSPSSDVRQLAYLAAQTAPHDGLMATTNKQHIYTHVALTVCSSAL